MKIAFLGFDQWHGKFNIGSSRIRCDWLIKNWPEAERFKMGGKYDVIIFQKSYWVEYAKAFKGFKILDMCDPDWLEMDSRVIEMMREVDLITTSSQELAEYLINFTDKKIICVPDRIDLDSHRERKQHFHRAKAVVWFGYRQNFPVLHQVLKLLEKLKLELIVISNGPYHLPSQFIGKVDLTNYIWDPINVNKDIIKGDMVINPRLSDIKFKFKSNNKTLTSWALGMPVANNDEDLKRFIDPTERTKEAEKRLKEIRENWDVKKSVEEFKNIINKYYVGEKK